MPSAVRCSCVAVPTALREEASLLYIGEQLADGRAGEMEENEEEKNGKGLGAG